MLAGARLRTGAEKIGASFAAKALISPEELEKTTPSRFTAPTPQSSDIAFLQLTSGSTGLPRAVQITHGGALHNARAIDVGIGTPYGGPIHDHADALVAWLPLHHDMGLIGCLFLASLGGLDLWLFPTLRVPRPASALAGTPRKSRGLFRTGAQLRLSTLRRTSGGGNARRGSIFRRGVPP